MIPYNIQKNCLFVVFIVANDVISSNNRLTLSTPQCNRFPNAHQVV